MNKQRKDLILLGLAACAAVASLYFAFMGGSPKIDLDTYATLGAVAAEETAKLLGNQGRVVVVARDTGADKNPSVEAELVAFHRTLKRLGGVKSTTERFVATPMMMMATGGSIPTDQLVKALESHTDAGAVVLFCGLPPLGDAEVELLRQRKIKTVVVAALRPDYGQLLKQGVIHLAITPRQDGAEVKPQPARSLRERFDQDYVIISAADVAR